MSDPIFINCPADQWTKVATNVTSGKIHKLYEQPYGYISTYRMTGNPAPTLKSDGVKMFVDDNLVEKINAPLGIDVYVYPILRSGKIRVDAW